MIKLYLKQAWTMIKAASALYRNLRGGYRTFNSPCHDIVHYFLCEVCAHISRI